MLSHLLHPRTFSCRADDAEVRPPSFGRSRGETLFCAVVLGEIIATVRYAACVQKLLYIQLPKPARPIVAFGYVHENQIVSWVIGQEKGGKLNSHLCRTGL